MAPHLINVEKHVLSMFVSGRLVRGTLLDSTSLTDEVRTEAGFALNTLLAATDLDEQDVLLLHDAEVLDRNFMVKARWYAIDRTKIDGFLMDGQVFTTALAEAEPFVLNNSRFGQSQEQAPPETE